MQRFSSLFRGGKITRDLGSYQNAEGYIIIEPSSTIWSYTPQVPQAWLRLMARQIARELEQVGEQHPDTALSLNNLGYLMSAQGHTARESARPYYERALAILERRLGANHPHTQIVRGNLESLEGLEGG